MNQASRASSLSQNPRAVVLDGLRKCGCDFARMSVAMQGIRRRLEWQKSRAVDTLEAHKFAFMLADERAGRG